MKKPLKAVPLLIVLALITYTCSDRISGNSPTKNVFTASESAVWQVKKGYYRCK